MTELRALTAEELCPALAVLTGLPEKTPFDSLPAIVDRLGWTLQGLRRGVTNLPVSLQLFGITLLKNDDDSSDIVKIHFRVTDTLQDATWYGKQLVIAAAPVMVETISECLGFPPTRPKWVQPGFTWDLPDGKQVVLDQGEDVLVVQVWAKRLADIERHEIDHDIDPAHDLDDRPC